LIYGPRAWQGDVGGVPYNSEKALNTMSKVSTVTPTSPFQRGRKRTALILIPGSVNYFYNLSGRRLAEALRDLSFEVDVATLTDCPVTAAADWCVVSNISEVLHAFGDMEAGIEKLVKLKKSCGAITQVSMECATTQWFRLIQEQCQAVGIQSVLDMGLHDQLEHLTDDARSTYFCLPAGLTTSELQSLDDDSTLEDSNRTIPWTFVGHYSPDRAALVDILVREIDPRGFVYIPHLHHPCTEKGSPHLNQQEFDKVLRRAQYQIWCAHHNSFYMECERFRMSLLAGGVPVKVLTHARAGQRKMPFSSLMIEERDLSRRLREFDFHEVRRQFREEYRRITPLKIGLAQFLAEVSVIERDEASLAPSKRPHFVRAA
jgi:hypothetical protein